MGGDGVSFGLEKRGWDVRRGKGGEDVHVVEWDVVVAECWGRDDVYV